jgi:hypothetical protein
MRAGSLIFTGLLTTALAAPLLAAQNFAGIVAPVISLQTGYQRIAFDGPSIIDALKKIDADNVKNKELLDAFDGDIASAVAIQTNSQLMADDIAALAEVVKASPPLTMDQAIELGKVSEKMNADVVAGLEALTAKKPAFDQIGVSSVVLGQLQAQGSSKGDATALIAAKLPEAARSYSKAQPDAIAAALAKAVAAYSVPAPGSEADEAPAKL